MKHFLWIPPTFAMLFALVSCGNSGGGSSAQSGTGPFDRNGNYVEEWADNPSKWRKTGSSPSPHELKSDRLPRIAANTQPPPGNVAPRVVSAAPSQQAAPVIYQTQIVPKTSPAAREVVVLSKPKPKPKPVLVKAKPKPKPKAKPQSIRYIVRKGDSLSIIASRTGASVTAIKNANGISGSVIRPGQSLKIPKR